MGARQVADDQIARLDPMFRDPAEDHGVEITGKDAFGHEIGFGFGTQETDESMSVVLSPFAPRKLRTRGAKGDIRFRANPGRNRKQPTASDSYATAAGFSYLRSAGTASMSMSISRSLVRLLAWAA